VGAAARALGIDLDRVPALTAARARYGLSYAQFVVLLVRAVQELSAENPPPRPASPPPKLKAPQATATLQSFEARLRRLEVATGGQAQRWRGHLADAPPPKLSS